MVVHPALLGVSPSSSAGTTLTTPDMCKFSWALKLLITRFKLYNNVHLFSLHSGDNRCSATQNSRISTSSSARLGDKEQHFCEWVINIVGDAVPTYLLYPHIIYSGYGRNRTNTELQFRG